MTVLGVSRGIVWECFASGARDSPNRLAGEGGERSMVETRCHAGDKRCSGTFAFGWKGVCGAAARLAG